MPGTTTLSTLSSLFLSSKLYPILQSLISMLALVTLIYTCTHFTAKKNVFTFVLELGLFTFLLLDLVLRGLAGGRVMGFMAKGGNAIDVVLGAIFGVAIGVSNLGQDAGSDWFINSCNVVVLCSLMGRSFVALGNTIC